MSDRKERTCEGCSLCCTINRVHQIRNEAGKPCTFDNRQVTKGRCSIYGQDKRPMECGIFHCDWLTGQFPEELAPRAVGAYMILDSNRKILNVFAIDESFLHQDPLKTYLMTISLGLLVQFNVRGKIGILYNGTDPQMMRKTRLLCERLGVPSPVDERKLSKT